jgi:hypothetical protein
MLRRNQLRSPSLLALSEWQEKEARNQLQVRAAPVAPPTACHAVARRRSCAPAAQHPPTAAAAACLAWAQSAVDEDGSLLDNLTLELRVHPPSIEIDNSAHDRWTTVTIDSANRPGSLIYVSFALFCPRKQTFDII